MLGVILNKPEANYMLTLGPKQKKAISPFLFWCFGDIWMMLALVLMFSIDQSNYWFQIQDVQVFAKSCPFFGLESLLLISQCHWLQIFTNLTVCHCAIKAESGKWMNLTRKGHYLKITPRAQWTITHGSTKAQKKNTNQTWCLHFLKMS